MDLKIWQSWKNSIHEKNTLTTNLLKIFARFKKTSSFTFQEGFHKKGFIKSFNEAKQLWDEKKGGFFNQLFIYTKWLGNW